MAPALATPAPLSDGNSDVNKYAFENLNPYTHPPETKEDLPWSELVTLDLSEYEKPGGKEALARQLEHAVQHVGFVCFMYFLLLYYLAL